MQTITYMHPHTPTGSAPENAGMVVWCGGKSWELITEQLAKTTGHRRPDDLEAASFIQVVVGPARD